MTLGEECSIERLPRYTGSNTASFHVRAKMTRALHEERANKKYKVKIDGSPYQLIRDDHLFFATPVFAHGLLEAVCAIREGNRTCSGTMMFLHDI